MSPLPTIRINDVSLDQLSYNDVPVVTFQQIAEVHGISVTNVHKSFRRNKKRFIEGKHFYLVEKDRVDLESIGTNTTIYLFTEKGYLLLTKPLRDQTSWEVQERMIDDYFTLKTALTEYSDLVAIQNTLVKLAEVRDAQKLLEAEQRAQDRRILEQSQRISEATLLAQQALQAQMTMTLRYYRYIEKLEHQLPDPLLHEFSRYIAGYCIEKGIPVGKEPVAHRQYGTENRYPVALIAELLPPWIARRNGQSDLQIDA
jgi:phage regulator Rha-like protein